MLISVNGKEHQSHDGTTVEQLLQQLEVTGPLAVELNRRICPKKNHQDTVLHSGDVVEIVTIVGGG